VLFEEGPEVRTLLAPMVDDDLFGVKFEKVEAAAPDDQPDDAVAVVYRELRQPLG